MTDHAQSLVVSPPFCHFPAAAACGHAENNAPPAPAGTPRRVPGKEALAAGPPMSALPPVDAARRPAAHQSAVLQQVRGTRAGHPRRGPHRRLSRDAVPRPGLQPGNPDGTYIQKVPLVGITAAETGAADLRQRRAGPRRSSGKTTWSPGRSTSPTAPPSTQSDVVFVGYGVDAPEYNWDDFKGVDVKGKTIVVLVNDPPVPDPRTPSKLDPKTFGGKAMTYYGRWTYKFEEGARKGAAGVLIVHETGPAGYPVPRRAGQSRARSSTSSRPTRTRAARTSRAGSRSTRREKLFAMAGQDFDALKKQAATREFKPVPLGVTGVDGDQEHAAHDRLAERGRQARGQRPAAEGRVRRLHGALGSPRHRASRSTATTSTTARSTTRRASRRCSEIAQALTKRASRRRSDRSSSWW